MKKLRKNRNWAGKKSEEKNERREEKLKTTTYLCHFSPTHLYFFLVPTICPSVSEDAVDIKVT